VAAAREGAPQRRAPHPKRGSRREDDAGTGPDAALPENDTASRQLAGRTVYRRLCPTVPPEPGRRLLFLFWTALLPVKTVFFIRMQIQGNKMSLPNAYSLKTSCIPRYFEAISNATIPDRFDTAFLNDLGFRYAIDRSFVDIMRELGFLNAEGTPTKRYYEFHDRRYSQQSLVVGIKAAYYDLFEIHGNAYALSMNDLSEKLKFLYAGKKNDIMIAGIAKTFQALCKYAGLGEKSSPEDAPASALPQDETVSETYAWLQPSDSAFNNPRDTTSPLQPVPEARHATTQHSSGNNPENPVPKEHILDLTGAIEETAATEGPKLDLTDAFAAPVAEPSAAPQEVLSPARETAPAGIVPDAAPLAAATPDVDAPESHVSREEILLLTAPAVAEGLTLDLTDAFAAPAAEPPAADAPEAQVSREEIVLLTGAIKAMAAEASFTLDLAEALAVPAQESQAAPAATASPDLETPALGIVPTAPSPAMAKPDASEPETTLPPDEIFEFVSDIKTMVEKLHASDTREAAVADSGQAAPTAEEKATGPLPEAKPARTDMLRIKFVLPESRDPRVYDAIFTSLKKNFL